MSNLFVTLAAFVVALGSLVTFHELGHFVVARLCGVKVLRFSVGFGTPVWSRRAGRDGTEWTVAAIPLGGYVKMLDEREGDVAASERHRAFNRQNVWRRSAIVAAGPIANFLLAIALYWVLAVHGMPGVRPVVALPPAGTPAAAAHFEAGDVITHVGPREVRTLQELRWAVLQAALERGRAVLEVERLAGGVDTRTLDLAGVASEDLDADFLSALGLVQWQPPIEPVVAEALEGRPAALAGIRAGDRIVGVDGVPVERWDTFVTRIHARAGMPTVIDLERDGATLQVSVTPDSEREGGRTIGRVGIAPRVDREALQRHVVEIRHGPLEAVGVAIARTWDASVFSLQMMGRMLMGQISPRNLSGPLTIADYAGQSALLGWVPYLGFLALISISLGVLNLLPVPLLDGGHLLYYLVEIVKGAPVSERAAAIGQRIGMVVLFSLMAFALFNDLQRLAGGS
ncbi:MAG: RIP metalloprotease RseP [Burkholderiales bacterium]|nr:RIP metalloprotease RseP [Burkholderiales bacterium]